MFHSYIPVMYFLYTWALYLIRTCYSHWLLLNVRIYPRSLTSRWSHPPSHCKVRNIYATCANIVFSPSHNPFTLIPSSKILVFLRIPYMSCTFHLFFVVILLYSIRTAMPHLKHTAVTRILLNKGCMILCCTCQFVIESISIAGNFDSFCRFQLENVSAKSEITFEVRKEWGWIKCNNAPPRSKVPQWRAWARAGKWLWEGKERKIDSDKDKKSLWLLYTDIHLVTFVGRVERSLDTNVAENDSPLKENAGWSVTRGGTCLRSVLMWSRLM